MQIDKKYKIKRNNQYVGEYTYKGCKLVDVTQDPYWGDEYNCDGPGVDCTDTTRQENTVECHRFTNEDVGTYYAEFSRDPKFSLGNYDFDQVFSTQGLQKI